MTDEKENPAKRVNASTGPEMSNEKRLDTQAPQPRHGVKTDILVTLTNGVNFTLSSNTRLAIVFNRLVGSGEKGISRLDLEIGEHLPDIIFRLKRRGLSIDKRTQTVRRFATYWIPQGSILSVSK